MGSASCWCQSELCPKPPQPRQPAPCAPQLPVPGTAASPCTEKLQTEQGGWNCSRNVEQGSGKGPEPRTSRGVKAEPMRDVQCPGLGKAASKLRVAQRAGEAAWKELSGHLPAFIISLPSTAFMGLLESLLPAGDGEETLPEAKPVPAVPTGQPQRVPPWLAPWAHEDRALVWLCPPILASGQQEGTVGAETRPRGDRDSPTLNCAQGTLQKTEGRG